MFKLTVIFFKKRLALFDATPYDTPRFQGDNSSLGNHPDAGWSSLVARRAHNPKVVGSNPAPATNSFRKN